MDNWQRISKIAIVDFFLKPIIRIVSSALYAIPIVLASFDTLKNNVPYVILGMIALICLLALSASLQYYFFKYRLRQGNIEIHTGVLFKKHLDLPFTRIQNVKLITPVYFRPFNYTTIELDTAGSVKNEARIVAVPMVMANDIKQQILVFQQTQQSTSDENIKNNDENSKNENTVEIIGREKLLNERSFKDLIIHGVTSNRVFIFLAMLAPMADTLFEKANAFFLNLGFDIKGFLFESEHPWWQLSLYFMSTFIIAYLIVMLFSVLGAVIAFYGYKLTKRDNNYIQRSGLLSIHEVVMKKARLQMVVRQQDWLDVLIKRVNLQFNQMGGVERNKQNSLRNKLMVPSVKIKECHQLIDEVWPTNNMTNINYQTINLRFIVRGIGFYITPLTSIICLIAFLSQQWALWPIAFLFFCITSLLLYCRWRRWGYAMDDEFIYVRKGLFGVNYYCFAIEKIQMVKFKQSIFLRRHKLCHNVFVTAASTLTIPFISQDIGWKMLSISLYDVESLKKSWM